MLAPVPPGERCLARRLAKQQQQRGDHQARQPDRDEGELPGVSSPTSGSEICCTELAQPSTAAPPSAASPAPSDCAAV